VAPKHCIPALLILLAASFGSPSFAQTPDPDDEPDIVCTADLIRWLPSPQDTKAIQSQPVPASFRWPSRGGHPCQSSPLFSDILYWHLSFGTEASALAAVDVFASKALDWVPRSDVRAEMMKSWQRDLGDYQRAEQQLAQDPENKALRRAVRNARSRLSGVAFMASTYGYAAGPYLEVGDAFASQRALAQAERILALEAEAQAFVTLDLAKEPDPVARDVRQEVVNYVEALRESEARRLRLAVLRARLMRTPETIDAAAALLQAAFRPEFREAWELLNQRNRVDDVCRFGMDRPQALAQACGRGSFFEDEMTGFFITAAQLEVVIAGQPDIRRRMRIQGAVAFEPYRVMDWLEARWRERSSGSFFWKETAPPRILTLMLMQADVYARDTRLLSAAEQLLLRAERRTLPYESPTGFRQIAGRYLQVYRTNRSLAEDARKRGEWVAPSDSARVAAYFQRVLKDLDAIATAE
jgi:hypothetical protein